MFIWRDSYISYLNLDHRIDRLIHIEQELLRVGIKAERTRGKLPNEFDLFAPHLQVMRLRTAGAIGCHYGQVEIMKTALEKNKSAFVLEDDCVMGTDIQERLDYIEKFINNQDDWDVIFLGGTVHIGPPWWHKQGHSPDLQACDCTLQRDAELTDDPRMVRTYGAFSTHAYIVNVKSIEKILSYFNENVHLSMGIDWLFIKMQPQLKAYMFLPGCIKQLDNMSDIGFGITRFSSFSKLNGSLENSAYWWADKISDFDPAIFDFKEAKI